jgi:hydroxyacyl-ACP dehydratase HTD2-like protein with hotdog domain
MSKIQTLKRTSTLALRQRKAHLLRSFLLPPEILHASLIQRFMKCGKANCHCHTDPGAKHGPFYYLNRCFAKGKMQSLLLKSTAQVDEARQSVAAYAQVQARLDEISQINHELLRRGEPLVADAS